MVWQSGPYVQKPWTKWGNGNGGSWWGKKPEGVPAGMEIDKDARYQGTVSDYWKWQGYGFITPNQSGLVPKDKIYVHWSNIQTDDRYPFLTKGMDIEFGLMKWKDKGVETLRAKYVTMPGGVAVAVQDEADAQNKTFVGGQNLRYSGNLKFYDPARKFGYVKLDEGYDLDADVPKELQVEEHEVNCGGKRPQMFMEKLAVEFGIYKNKKGQYRVYNMCLPGGGSMARESIEGREVLGTSSYSGVISFWNWSANWGHIKPNPGQALPIKVRQKMAELLAEAQKKAKPGSTPEEALYFRKQDCGKGFSKP